MSRRRVTALAAAGLALALLPLAACTSKDAPEPAPDQAISVPDDLSAGRSEPVADPVYPDRGNPAIDVLHYGLSFVYDPDTTVLTGLARLTIRPTADADHLSLDFAAGMEVTESTMDGTRADAAREGQHLVLPASVHADRNVVVTVAYHGVPAPQPAPAQRGDMGGGIGMHVEPDGSLWTMQEPFGAYTWYPVNDHPSDEALYDIAVTTPSDWLGVATGSLQGTDQVDGGYVRTRWRASDPVASYVTTLAVDHFGAVKGGGPDGSGRVFASWYPDAYADGWERPVARIPDYLAWLEERFGPYPFPTVGVVVVSGESGMETQGLITVSAGLSSRGLDQVGRVLVHELAHQWFGDSVSPRDWKGIWLNEGMATYAEAMWAVDQGQLTEEAAVAVWRDADQQLRDQAGPPGAYQPRAFASRNVYFCSALMLYELRRKLGDDVFGTMLRDWAQQKNTHQDRASFTAFVNEHAGRDMTGFIDAWLDSPTTPGA